MACQGDLTAAISRLSRPKWHCFTIRGMQAVVKLSRQLDGYAKQITR
ncbi:hypothetical protein [uncultured Hoeflea sp.]|tara:strand:- start:1089 stop:1229 length:141 start_codon:yes stop_codon:yes gene_type:complete